MDRPSPTANARFVFVARQPARAAQLDIGNPVAAPALPSNLISPRSPESSRQTNLDKYLKHLWNLAYDLENDFNAAEEIKDDDFYWATIDDLEEYEYYLWEEIDDVIDSLRLRMWRSWPATR